MLLTVRLWGPLARYAEERGGPEFTLEVAGGTTVDALVDLLGVPREYVSMVSVNGAKAARDRLLADGDVVHVLPLVAGG